MKNAQLPLTVSLKDMSGAHKIELFFDTFADVTAGGLKMKRVARIAADQHDIDGTEFYSHARVWTEVFSGAAHRAQTAGFSAAHGDLKNRTSRRIVGIQEVFRLGKKRGPEKFNRFAYLLAS